MKKGIQKILYTAPVTEVFKVKIEYNFMGTGGDQGFTRKFGLSNDGYIEDGEDL
jgi:hypothetical protein